MFRRVLVLLPVREENLCAHAARTCIRYSIPHGNRWAVTLPTSIRGTAKTAEARIHTVQTLLRTLNGEPWRSRIGESACYTSSADWLAVVGAGSNRLGSLVRRFKIPRIFTSSSNRAPRPRPHQPGTIFREHLPVYPLRRRRHDSSEDAPWLGREYSGGGRPHRSR